MNHLRISLLSLIFSITCLSVAAQDVILYKPLDSAVISGGDVEFLWKPRPGGGTFFLDISNDSQFINSQTYQTNQPGISVSGLAVPGNYWWRVRYGTDTSEVRFIQTTDFKSWGGLCMWLRADTGLTVQNGLVASWNDLSDSLRNTSQAGILLRPEYIPSWLGGYPAVKFGKNGASGQQTYLEFTPLVLPNADLTFVGLWDEHYDNNYIQYILGGTGQGIYSGGMITNLPGATNAGIFINPNAFGGTGKLYMDPAVNTIEKTAVYRNGAPIPITGPIHNQNITIRTLGVRPDNLPLFFTATMPEFLLFNQVLPDSLQRMAERYFFNRYGSVARLPADTMVCSPSFQLNLPNGSDFDTIIWSTGSSDPQITITSSGTYWVQVTNHFGLTTTDTIQVSGIFPYPLTTVDPGTYYICTGDTMVNVYENPDPTQPWYWSNGETGDTLLITAPGTYQLFQPDSSGCLFSTPPVIVLKQMRADFYVEEACEGDVVQFIDLSEDEFNTPIVSFQWDFGPFATPFPMDNDTAYTLFLQGGIHQIKLVATNMLGCVDTIIKAISISPKPGVDFSFNGSCVGNPVQFSNLTSLPPNTSLNTVKWQFDQLGQSTQVSPQFTFNQAGTYEVKLVTGLNNGCKDSVTHTVVINKSVDADFSIPQDSLCSGTSYTFSDGSVYNNTQTSGIIWKSGNQIVGSGSPAELSFNQPGLHPLRLVIKSADQCTDSIQHTILVKQTPEAEISLNQNLGLPPLDLVVSDASTGQYPYRKWEEPFGIDPQGPTFQYSIPDTGLYAISLKVWDNNGCSDSTQVLIRVVTPQLHAELDHLECYEEDGYIKARIRTTNLSNYLPITEMVLNLSIDRANIIQERWTGTLAHGGQMEFTFSSGVLPINTPGYCCVEIPKIISTFGNGQSISMAGERICVSLGSEYYSGQPFPNPVTDHFEMFMVLPVKSKVQIQVSDALGNQVYNESFEGEPGLNNYSIFTQNWASGVYIVNTVYREHHESYRVVVTAFKP